MAERLVLAKNLDSRTFRDFYYLKEELTAFCRENGLPVSGGKEELTDRIAYFLETGKAKKAIVKSRKAVNVGDIEPDTIIEDNFVCSEKHRAFFKKHIGNSFSFNVAFQKWLKSNAGKTLDDAIKCWKYKKQMEGHNRYERSDLAAVK